MSKINIVQVFFIMYFTTASCNRQEATECDLQSYSKTTSMTASHISCGKITCFFSLLYTCKFKDFEWSHKLGAPFFFFSHLFPLS